MPEVIGQLALNVKVLTEYYFLVTTPCTMYYALHCLSTVWILSSFIIYCNVMPDMAVWCVKVTMVTVLGPHSEWWSLPNGAVPSEKNPTTCFHMTCKWRVSTKDYLTCDPKKKICLSDRVVIDVKWFRPCVKLNKVLEHTVHHPRLENCLILGSWRLQCRWSAAFTATSAIFSF